jgi:small-conductance mechanosensitive channel
MNRKILLYFCAVFLISLLSSPPSNSQNKNRPQAPPETKTESSSLVLGENAVIPIQKGIGGNSAQTRAREISERLAKLAEDFSVPNNVTTRNFEGPLTQILVGDKPLMVILDQDTVGTTRSREELSQDYAREIQEAIQNYRRQFQFREILSDFLYSVVATIVLLVVLILLNRGYRKLDTKLQSWMVEGKLFHRLKRFEFIPLERVQSLERGSLKLIRLAVILAVLYFYVHMVLGFFPWTRPYVNKISGYIVQPFKIIAAAIWEEIPNLFFVAILILISLYVIKIFRLLFNEIEKGNIVLKGFHPEWAQHTYKIFRLLVLAFAAVVAFPYIPGSSSQAFKGISIFIGVLFSLGSTSAIANIIAGYMIIYRRVFRVGDRIKIADFTGDVIEIRLQVTHLKTIKNEEIIVPNSMIVNSHVINYSTMAGTEGLILYTSVTIGYDAPWRTVHELLIKAALATKGILKDPPPFVLQRALNDFYVSYELNAYTQYPRQMVVIYSDLHQNIQDQFNEGGVEIMSPHYTQLRDGNKTTIPENYLPPDYTPAGFRINSPWGPKNKNAKGQEG